MPEGTVRPPPPPFAPEIKLDNTSCNVEFKNERSCYSVCPPVMQTIASTHGKDVVGPIDAFGWIECKSGAVLHLVPVNPAFPVPA